MKNSIILLVLFLSSSFNINAQWQPDVRLTNDPAVSQTSWNNAWCISSIGTTIHVIWYDRRDGNYEIYYKRSSNSGISWGKDIRLTNNSEPSLNPSISAWGSYVSVAWSDNRDGNEEIYCKRSTNGGISWGNDVRLTNNSAGSQDASIKENDIALHVVWRDYRNGINPNIYYKRSTDNGVTWSSDIRLTTDPAGSYVPSIALSEQNIHIVWSDYRHGSEEIYYKRSVDGGLNWSPDTRLTNNTVASVDPSIAVSNLDIHVVWYEYINNKEWVYYKNSTDGGSSWNNETRIENDSSRSWNPSIAVSNNNVHVVWNDLRHGNVEVYYKYSIDGGINWGEDTRLTNNTGLSNFASISISDSIVNVLWYDDHDGNREIYYKRNPTGNPIGITNISSEIPREFSLSQNYPNPFNPTTKIKFQISGSGFVKLIVYDILGSETAALVNEELSTGTYETDWDASNYPSGVYYYKLTAGDFTETKKMILIK